jgi:DNA-binding CsgD family transcriptional regulator
MLACPTRDGASRQQQHNQNLLMNPLSGQPLVTYRLRAGIVIATYRELKSPVTLEQAKTIVRDRLTFQKGAAYPMLIICPYFMWFKTDAARFLHSHQAMEGVKAGAILLKNRLLVRIARLFLHKDGSVPVQVFSVVDTALNWLRQECGIAGGAGLRPGLLKELEDVSMYKPSRKPTLPAKTTATLTARELEVARLVAQGMTNKDIADLLGITVATVKKHRENINRKLKIKNAVELLLWLIENNLL